MSFDYLGTFNKSQLDRFLAFGRSQAPLIDARIIHLSAEMNRLGAVTFSYAQGVPQEFTVNPPESYLGQLVAAYEVLGGDPFHDLRVRSKNDPVYAVRSTEAVPVQYMSNGEIIGAKGLADAATAETLRKGRTWLNETLRTRFDRLERKIRRTVDYSDELQNEIDDLTAMKQTLATDGSFEQLAATLTQLVTDPNYRSAFDDGGTDPFGLTVYAPFSSYDVVASTDPNLPTRSADTAQRQNTGFVSPNAVGTETVTTSAADAALEAEENPTP